jgi:Tfp pilus assembly protein PilX
MEGGNGFRSGREEGSVLLMAMLVLIMLSLLGFVFLTSSGTEGGMAANGLWSEGAFNAAEAGIHRGIDQISGVPTTSIQSVAVTAIGDSYTYRSGRRTDATPQPFQFVRTQNKSGYSLESGTGYNAAGYAFYVYQLNATGQGPLNAQREIEVQAEYGPASK